MEGGKQTSSSSTSDVFGSKEGSSSAEAAKSSSPGIFSALFPPPTKEPFHFLEVEKKKDYGNHGAKIEAFGNSSVCGENGSRVATEKDKNSYFQDERVQPPFHYNSSIYYGGQDVFIQPPSGQSSSSITTYNKDSGEDDKNIASRGNWWQGSLYY